jgi:hypothetical protein
MLDSTATLGGDGGCTAIQTYKISSTGELTFEGSTLSNTLFIDMPAVTGNGEFAYALAGYDDVHFTSFSRESSTGVLNVINTTETDPAPNPISGVTFIPQDNVSPDPTNHLAVSLYQEGSSAAVYQLASYTVDSQGNTVSTNTWENMPILPDVWALKLDPTGKYLAVATLGGVQIFHFNGADPITPFTNIIGTSGYEYLSWDNCGHLYAVDDSGELHVYTVSSHGITESQDSPTASGLFLSGNPIVVRAE